MSVKDMVYDHERRITVMSKALHCLKLEVRDLEDWIREKNKIVRCKDCKYMKVHGWNPKKEVSTCHFHCEFWNHAVDDCDFCSRGEKKDE